MIHSLGNDFAPTDRKHWGRKNIGFIFFENTTFSVQGLERARSFDLILAGSRWNAQILSKLGIKKVAYVMQGIDRQRFESVSPQKHPGKFVIFSGGKLEYRKGQDIVLAAFKEFYKRHPDSVLLTAWYNPWPQITQDLVNSPFGFGVPRIVDNQVDVAEWCSRSGLPSSAFMHIGLTPNAQMPTMMRPRML